MEGIPFPVPFAFGRTREAERVAERVAERGAERGGGMGFSDGERVLPLVGDGGGSAAEEAEAAGSDSFPLPLRVGGVSGRSVGRGVEAAEAAEAADAGRSVGGDTGGVAPCFLRASKM